MDSSYTNPSLILKRQMLS